MYFLNVIFSLDFLPPVLPCKQAGLSQAQQGINIASTQMSAQVLRPASFCLIKLKSLRAARDVYELL